MLLLSRLHSTSLLDVAGRYTDVPTIGKYFSSFFTAWSLSALLATRIMLIIHQGPTLALDKQKWMLYQKRQCRRVLCHLFTITVSSQDPSFQGHSSKTCISTDQDQIYVLRWVSKMYKSSRKKLTCISHFSCPWLLCLPPITSTTQQAYLVMHPESPGICWWPLLWVYVYLLQ
jgi:hypothetical protein